jgi:hypothetical protein
MTGIAGEKRAFKGIKKDNSLLKKEDNNYNMILKNKKSILFKIMPGIQINYLIKAEGTVILIDRPNNFFDLEASQKFILS